MKRLFSGLLGSVGMVMLTRYRKLALDWVRIRGAICYVEGVRVARKGFLAGLLLALCLVLGGSGFVLFHVGLFLVLPVCWRGPALMGLGSVYMIAVLLILRWVCAEKTWMECSHANRYVAAATKTQVS